MYIYALNVFHINYTFAVTHYKLYICSYNRRCIINQQLLGSLLVPLPFVQWCLLLAAENKVWAYLPSNPYTWIRAYNIKDNY